MASHWSTHKLYIPLITIALATVGRAQSIGGARLISQPFKEELDMEVPLGGQTIAGIVAADRSTEFTGSVFVYSPAGGERNLCLQVRTRDGTYRSVNTYLLPATASAGFVSLPYPTKYGPELRGTGSGDLAILAALGTCRVQSADYLASAMQATITAPTRLRVLISSGGAKVTIYDPSRPADALRACAPFRQGLKRAFDTMCELDPGSVSGGIVSAAVVEQVRDDPPFRTSFTVHVGHQ